MSSYSRSTSTNSQSRYCRYRSREATARLTFALASMMKATFTLRSESERINVELFKKYFNKQPVTVLPVPIKRSNGTVDVRFSIYDEGDVYVEIGIGANKCRAIQEVLQQTASHGIAGTDQEKQRHG